MPLIERLLARKDAPPIAVRARLAHPLPANAIRQHYMRAILEPASDKLDGELGWDALCEFQTVDRLARDPRSEQEPFVSWVGQC